MLIFIPRSTFRSSAFVLDVFAACNITFCYNIVSLDHIKKNRNNSWLILASLVKIR